jgi:WD40 repeat protein
MGWPLSQDYNEAIQDPPSAFTDPELRGGQLRLNALGLPLPFSGNFADVYEVNCPASESKWAVKCFTRQVPGLQQRYTAVSRHLHHANLPFTVDFVFLTQGIRIRGEWYPVLKMRWVEGFLLNQFIRDNLDKPALLQALQQIWVRLSRKLRDADIAHADLQHGNVMLVPGSKAAALAVKLIDYDGMWVPALAKSKSGEVGHPNYQHPQRLREGTYNREVDRFPFLVTATALRAVAVGGRSLWERYDNGDNLLFKESDLSAPETSPVFQELGAASDAALKRMVGQLRQACRARLEEVPLLDEVPAEEKRTAVQASPPPVPVPTTAPAGSVTTAWDFEATAAEAEKPRRKGRRRKRAGVPGWVWAAGGVGVAAILGVVFALVLLNRDRTPASQVAVNNTSPSSKPLPPPTSQPAPPTSARVPDTRVIPPETRIVPPDTGKLGPPPPMDPPPARALFQMLGNSKELLAMAGDKDAVWQLYNTFEPNPDKKVVRRFVAPQVSPVIGFQASPDGAFAVTLCEDHRAYLWDTKKSEPILTMRSNDDRYPIVVVGVTPDGTQALTSHGGKNYGVWEVQKQQMTSAVGVEGNLSALAVSADGARVACSIAEDGATEQLVTVRDLLGGIVHKLGQQRGRITCLAFSPDGKRLASAGTDNGVRVWDIEKEGESVSYEGLRAPASRLLFSPDGAKIMAETGSQTVVWGVKSRKALGGAESPPEGRVTCNFDDGGIQLGIATQPKGKEITRGGGTLQADPTDTPVPVTGAAARPLFRKLANGSDLVAMEGEDGALWQLYRPLEKRAAQRFVVPRPSQVTVFQATPDGAFALTICADRHVYVWDTKTGEKVFEKAYRTGGPRKERPIVAGALAPDGSVVYLSHGGRTYEVLAVREKRGAIGVTVDGNISALAVSADGSRLAYGMGQDGAAEDEIAVRELRASNVRKLAGHRGKITCLAFSPNGKWLASAGTDNKVRLWDIERGVEAASLDGLHAPATVIFFSPDGGKFLAEDGYECRVWGVRSHRHLGGEERPPEDRVACCFDLGSGQLGVARQEKGKEISHGAASLQGEPADAPPPAAAGQGPFQMISPRLDTVAMTEGDGSVWRLQNVNQRDDVRRFVGHTAPIRCLAANASGQFAITGSEDRTARVWEVGTTKSIAEFKGHERAVSVVALSADRSLALTADGGKEAILWDVGKEIAIQRIPLPGVVSAMAFTPDAREAVFGFVPEGAKLTNVRVQTFDGTKVKDSPFAMPVPITAVATRLSNASSVVAVSADGTLLSWDRRTNQTRTGTVTGNGATRTITVSSDNKLILLCSERSYSVWSTRDFKELTQLVTAGPKMAASFTNDARKIARIELLDDGKLSSGTLNIPGDAPVVVKPPPDRRPPRPNRFEVPTGGKLEFARSEVHKAFKDLYDTNSPLLYNKLHDLTDHPIPGIAGSPDGRYVALIELRDHALKKTPPEFSTAITYSRRIGEQYKVDRLDELAHTVDKVSLAGGGAGAHKFFAQQVLEVLEEVGAEENPKAFAHLLKVVQAAAEKAKDPALAERVKRLSEGGAEAPKPSDDPKPTEDPKPSDDPKPANDVKAALDNLAKDPKDPEANLTVGLARCKEDKWDEALPHLAKGSNKEIQEAATMDLANPKAAAGRSEVAQKWLSMGIRDKAMAGVWFQRSRFWLQQALPDLTGQDLDQAKRLIEFIDRVLRNLPAKKPPERGQP